MPAGPVVVTSVVCHTLQPLTRALTCGTSRERAEPIRRDRGDHRFVTVPPELGDVVPDVDRITGDQ
jgi:hypothetical protein